MGWGEKHNPNSKWYQKRFPQLNKEVVEPVKEPEVIDVWQKIKDFICRLLHRK